MGTGAFNDGFYRVAEAQFREFLESYPQHGQVPEVMYLLGKALYEQKKFAEAKKVFTTLLASNRSPEASETVYFWLARSCQEVGDSPCAQEAFLTIIKKYPKSRWYPSSLYSLGKISFQNGQFARSEAYLREALKEQSITLSLSCLVNFWLGLALYEQGRYEEAEKPLQQALNGRLEESLVEETLYWLGETQVKLKKYKEGAETFGSFLKRFPQSRRTPNALFGESWCLVLLGRKEEALKGLLSLRKGFPHAPLLPQALSLMGEIYVSLDRCQEAVGVLKEFLDRFPQDPMGGKSLLNLAWCYLKLGNLVRVKEMAYEIVKLTPVEREKDLAQYILAKLNSYEGKCREAMPYWFQLVNVSAYRQEALFNIALCSFREGKFKESVVNLDLLQLEYPNFKEMDEALWTKGESFRELGNFSEASKVYEKIIKEHKRSPWHPWSIYRLITILLDKGAIEEGERWFGTLRKEFLYHELSYEAGLRLGIWKARRAQYESSLRYLDIAARSPDSKVAQNALCWKGEVYFNLKEYPKALDSYRRVVEGKPSQKDGLAAVAYLEIGNIKHLLGDQEGAKDAYKKAMDFSDDEEFMNKTKEILKELKKTGAGGS